ncbi:MAG: hypothetical protein WBA51_13075 [Erythrobacter sp.]
MPRRHHSTAQKQLKLPLFGALAAIMLALPTASLALVTFGFDQSDSDEAPLDLFTPASVDPDLAQRIASKAREKGLRFTPASSNPALRDSTVTVAVRIDADTAEAISVRKSVDSVPGVGDGIAALKTARFNLGTSRGYQSFARTVVLPDNVRNLSLPDLSEFEPVQPSAEKKPSRLQPRIELEDERLAGRSVNTLDDLGAQTVDVGGSFRLSSKVDVTAGVRLSQERERLDPLTNSVQDSQAVYVGTQIKF